MGQEYNEKVNFAVHTTVHGAWFAGECWFTWPQEIADRFPTQKSAGKKELGNKLRG
jgi:hypothetical protein